MEIIESEPDDIGPAVALTFDEIKTLIDLAKIGRKDIFYDLGSGHGSVVCTIVQETKVKKAIGIEVDYKRFRRSVLEAKKRLTKKQLERTELYCANYFSFHFSDATVIYEGHERYIEEVKDFKGIFGSHPLRIITLDLPLVGYRPVKSKSYKNTKFFLMRYPLKKYKVSSADKWASHVLSKRDVKINDVYSYYANLLKKRKFSAKEQRVAVRVVLLNMKVIRHFIFSMSLFRYIISNAFHYLTSLYLT